MDSGVDPPTKKNINIWVFYCIQWLTAGGNTTAPGHFKFRSPRQKHDFRIYTWMDQKENIF